MALDKNYLKPTCVNRIIPMIDDKKTDVDLESFCDAVGIKSMRIKLHGYRYTQEQLDNWQDYKTGKTKKKSFKAPMKCDWNNKYPVSGKPSGEYSFCPWDDEEYKLYLEIRDTITDYDVLAIDTRNIIQIDFDSDKDRDTVQKLKDANIPYYLSAKKKLEHFIIKDEYISDLFKKHTEHLNSIGKSLKDGARCNFATSKDPAAGDILAGQWAYALKGTKCITTDMSVPEVDVTTNYNIKPQITIGEQKEKLTKKQSNEINKIIKDNTDFDYDALRPMISELTECVNIKKYCGGDRNHWRNLVWSLHPYEDIARELSVKGNDYEQGIYDPNEFNEVWSCWRRGGLDIEDFYGICQEGNAPLYKSIRNKYEPIVDFNQLNTDYEIATKIFILKGTYWKYINYKLYFWCDRNRRWFLDKINVGSKTVDFIQDTIILWGSLQKKKIIELKVTADEQAKIKLENEEKLLDKKLNKIGQGKYLKNIAEALTNMLSRRNDTCEWDINEQLLAFKNKVWDNSTKTFRNQMKSDYILKNTGYDWIEPTKKQVRLIGDIFDKIFAYSKEVKECFISVARNGCVGKCPKCFVICIGDGDNAKSFINDFIRLMLCEDDQGYAYKGKVDTLCSQLKSGANPEVANMGGVYYSVFCEGSDKHRIVVATIKELTGGGTINARGCHQNETKKNLKHIVVFETNKDLRLDDFATKETNIITRFIRIPFKSEFGNYKTDDWDNYKFKCNTLYGTMKWKLEHRCALFSYLMNYQGETTKLDPECVTIYKPEIVLQATREYLADSDIISTFINENYSIDEELYENVKTIKTLLKNKEELSKEQEKYVKNGNFYTYSGDVPIVTLEQLYNEFKYTEEYKNMDRNARNAFTSTKFKKYVSKTFNKYFNEKYAWNVGSTIPDSQLIVSPKDKKPKKPDEKYNGYRVDYRWNKHKGGWEKIYYKPANANKVLFPFRKMKSDEPEQDCLFD